MATLLTTVGYGGTGSSAATNILEEFNSIKGLGNTFEMSFAADTDGISDLENAINENSLYQKDLAIKRFFKLVHTNSIDPEYKKHFNGKFEYYAKEYINSIIEFTFTGWYPRAHEASLDSGINECRIIFAGQFYKFLIKISEYQYGLYEPDGWKPAMYTPLTNIFFPTNSIDNFLKKTRIFTDNLLREENINKDKYILIDQAIPSHNPLKYMRYYTDPKVIIVDRDPRDIYTSAKALSGWGFIPTDDVDSFIKWFLVTRQNREEKIKDSSEILFLTFESLIYDYDNSIEKITQFLGFSECEHINKLKYFNPELSKTNTQLFLNYPSLLSEIKKIEKTLEKYCHPFPLKQYVNSEKVNVIEPIIRAVNYFKKTGTIPGEYKKYTLLFIFSMTVFYKAFNLFKIRFADREITFIKSLIKMFISLPLLPFEFIIVYIKLRSI
jgi:hypothetical protein